jgi:signal-transduction protein with cAMP-binding, CBS, and nucleotidyltransferase domain
MKTGELCNRTVVTAGRDTTITNAARLMRDHHVGSIVVVDETAASVVPVGILTDRDIVLEIIAKEVATDDVSVGDIMSYALLKVGEDDSVFEAAQRMRARGVRRAPVTGTGGELVGILALDDILELLSEELSLLAKLTARETEQEQRKRT